MTFRSLCVFAALLAFTATSAMAGEKTMMHCFAYTPIATATQAEWDAFHKASEEMPKKIKGVKRVWHGKLRNPLTLVVSADPAASKRVRAGETDVNAKLGLVKREHGMCIEMENEAMLKTYETHPYHKEWVAAYEKVRVAGTTTYQILGQ